jgi:ribosomal protein S11
MEQHNTPEPAATVSPRTPRAPRDAQRARQLAEERLATAQKVSDAVAGYHHAADRIDTAQAELSAAGEARLVALRALRACGLSVNEIVELTGLSSSRIQSLVGGR